MTAPAPAPTLPPPLPAVLCALDPAHGPALAPETQPDAPGWPRCRACLSPPMPVDLPPTPDTHTGRGVARVGR